MGKSKLRELWEWVDKQVEPKDDEDLKARRAKLDDITKKYFPPLGGFLGDPQDVDPAKIKRFNEKVGDYLDDVSQTPERIEKKVFGVIDEATRALKPVVNDPSSLLNQASTDVGDDLTDTPASDPGAGGAGVQAVETGNGGGDGGQGQAVADPTSASSARGLIEDQATDNSHEGPPDKEQVIGGPEASDQVGCVGCEAGAATRDPVDDLMFAPLPAFPDVPAPGAAHGEGKED
jgi:hypothetical protein